MDYRGWSPEEWARFLDELQAVGYGDIVQKFKKAEADVTAEMEARAKEAEKKIQVANLAQILFTAAKEGRVAHPPCQKDGKPILH